VPAPPLTGLLVYVISQLAGNRALPSARKQNYQQTGMPVSRQSGNPANLQAERLEC